jgi:hypothetical protein
MKRLHFLPIIHVAGLLQIKVCKTLCIIYDLTEIIKVDLLSVLDVLCMGNC